MVELCCTNINMNKYTKKGKTINILKNSEGRCFLMELCFDQYYLF